MLDLLLVLSELLRESGYIRLRIYKTMYIAMLISQEVDNLQETVESLWNSYFFVIVEYIQELKGRVGKGKCVIR